MRFYCGLRPSEAIALRWTDYRDGNFYITKGVVRGKLGATKTKIERIVAVHPVVKTLLEQTPKQTKNDHIVTTQHGCGYQSGDHLAQTFSNTCKQLGIPYRSPYNVRHTCATMMLEQGMKPAYCANVLGHSLEMFFNVYARWIDKHESEAQEKIWATME
jgi:integrase